MREPAAGAAGPQHPVGLARSSLSKADNAHDSTRRAPARTAQGKDTRERVAHAQEARTEMSHPTGRHCTSTGGAEQQRGRAVHADTSLFSPCFVKLKTKEGKEFHEADRLFRLSLSEGSTIEFCFCCIKRASPWKKSSEHGQGNLPFPFPLPAPGLNTGPGVNFTGISIKETRVLIMAEIPQVKSLSRKSSRSQEVIVKGFGLFHTQAGKRAIP